MLCILATSVQNDNLRSLQCSKERDGKGNCGTGQMMVFEYVVGRYQAYIHINFQIDAVYLKKKIKLENISSLPSAMYAKTQMIINQSFRIYNDLPMNIEKKSVKRISSA